MRWDDFPRPSVAVDVAALTVVPSAGRSGSWLGLLVHRRPHGTALAGQWDIPGGFLQKDESLAHAVRRLLGEKCGLPNLADAQGREPHQLHVFDNPGRDPRGWVLSVAHMIAVPFTRLPPDLVRGTDPDVRLARVAVDPEASAHSAPSAPGRPGTRSTRRLRHSAEQSKTPPLSARRVGNLISQDERLADSRPDIALELDDHALDLPWDHAEIVQMAVRNLRTAYRLNPDPERLLVTGSMDTDDLGEPQAFTLTELRGVHEAIEGSPIQRDNFSRMFAGRLERAGSTTGRGTVGRPAATYRHRSNEDPEYS